MPRVPGDGGTFRSPNSLVMQGFLGAAVSRFGVLFARQSSADLEEIGVDGYPFLP
jgi:hypothetical protein